VSGERRARFPVTVHLLFLRAGKVLLLRRFQTGYADGQYSVPAGHLDGGESVFAAGIREALEEVGVHVAERELAFSQVMHRRDGDERVDFFLEVKSWQGEPVNAEPEKCDDLQWARTDSLPQNTVPYVRRALENHLKKVRFSLFGWKG
jgi:8-oxo-dGTP pyrophosphatase MutT (NUDIX family)